MVSTTPGVGGRAWSVAAKLTSAIEEAGLGQATLVQLVPGEPEVIQVELDPASRTPARALSRWLNLITATDMIAGKFHRSDPVLRLSVRGRFPSGVGVIVVASFHEREDAAQVALIHAGISGRPATLVTQLAAVENTRGVS